MWEHFKWEKSYIFLLCWSLFLWWTRWKWFLFTALGHSKFQSINKPNIYPANQLTKYPVHHEINRKFSEAHHQGFSPGTLVSSPSSSVNRFSQQNKTKINLISTLSNLTAELSLRTAWHMTCCMWWAPDVLHMICTQLHAGHLSVRVVDSLWCSDEVVKNLELHLSMGLLLCLLLLLLH